MLSFYFLTHNRLCIFSSDFPPTGRWHRWHTMARPDPQGCNRDLQGDLTPGVRPWPCMFAKFSSPNSRPGKIMVTYFWTFSLTSHIWMIFLFTIQILIQSFVGLYQTWKAVHVSFNLFSSLNFHHRSCHLETILRPPPTEMGKQLEKWCYFQRL